MSNAPNTATLLPEFLLIPLSVSRDVYRHHEAGYYKQSRHTPES